MKECGSPTGIIFKRTIGFILFVIFLSIANFLVAYSQNQIYFNIVNFFNTNMILFLILFLMGTINEIFWNLIFPFNLIAPATSSILALIIVTLIYKIWRFVNVYLNSSIIIPINAIYVIVAIAVFIFGYLSVMIEGWRLNRGYEEEKTHKQKLKIKQKLQTKRRSNLGWADVGYQFKLMLYNLGDTLNRSFDQKKKRH